MQTILNIEGMICDHCKQTVMGALVAVDGVEYVTVNLDEGKAEVHHRDTVSKNDLLEAVELSGFIVIDN